MKHFNEITKLFYSKDFDGLVNYLKNNSSATTSIGYVLPKNLDMSDKDEIEKVAISFYLGFFFKSVPQANKLVEMLIDKDNINKKGYDILKDWFYKEIKE